MPRPSFQPTEEQRKTVKGMAGLGIPHDDNGVVLDIAPKTLRKHFRKELKRGSIEANAKVLQTLYSIAVSGNVTAAIFLAKTRCGLREREPQAKDTPVPVPQIIVRTGGEL